MQQLKKVLLYIFICCSMQGYAQQVLSYDEVNNKSYSLYTQSSWKDLLLYGKEAIRGGQDFSLLRQRMGYAAFMLNNFSEAVIHYEKALKNDSYNSTAHYYIWLCRKYLNQPELADAEVKYLTKEIIAQEKLKATAFTGAGFEVSYKQTQITSRQNALYARLDAGNRFGWNVHMLQAVASYGQKISEPLLTSVTNNRNININQFEYYNRLMINVSRHWQAKGAFHFVKTPFNNLSYNNYLVLAGVKYTGAYFDFQADAVFGKLSDSTSRQLNFQLGLYPMGNLNLYSFSTASVRQLPESGFNFRQVLGVKLMKKLWLEGNITLGSFSNLAENDALYLYNAIDPNRKKLGITTYITVSKKCIAQLGYTFEQRELYKQPILYNQHSITGGLSWKF